MEYWWVNQNQTYQFEVHGGYMWSPKANTNGARNQFYDNMTETRPGDVVFSFKDTYIKAVGIVVAALGALLEHGHASEFGAPNHQVVFQWRMAHHDHLNENPVLI